MNKWCLITLNLLKNYLKVYQDFFYLKIKVKLINNNFKSLNNLNKDFKKLFIILIFFYKEDQK